MKYKKLGGDFHGALLAFLFEWFKDYPPHIQSGIHDVIIWYLKHHNMMSYQKDKIK